ncbi:MAG TPA: LysM peptidoglycan-binding domain-containing protein [Gemmatimonadales bacterium]|nr:LysM peptidoglycan-binding domain-containing protein [Gemmatimonadales bacterium]
MTRRPLLAALAAAGAFGCGRLAVEERPTPVAPPPAPAPAPAQTPAPAVPRAARAVAPDTATDLAALDRLSEVSAPASIPELSIDDEAPSWDLNVQRYAEHPRVLYYVDYFTGRGRERFQIWLDRMPRYEAFAREQLASRGLPSDLVYLALIESGFSTQAVSRAKAVGMWQFMAPTGRAYGLRVDAWVDERRDPVKATVAAARHLKDLTTRFGSHYLAAAAYNAGAGRVGRGLNSIAEALGAGDELFDPASDEAFFELADTRLIHQETKDYVPKLIAAAILAKEPTVYGFEPPAEVAPFPLDSVVVDGGVGLDLIAKLADTTLAAIRELNPHILRAVTPPGSRYPVRVPGGTAERVAERYAAMPPVERPAMATHVVRRGETLSGIAARYGISQSLLKAANRSARARALQIGTTLYIPIAGGSIPEAVLAEAEPAAPARAVTHVVRRGETLSGIAARYGVSQSTLRAANKLGRSGAIRAGQKLTIRRGTTATASRTTERTTRAASTASVPVRRTHTVKSGETLGGIAERYGVRQSALQRANGMGKKTMVRVGQRLKVP